MLTVRPLVPSDWENWVSLGYADFYAVETNEDKLSTLFGWLLNPDHVCEGVVGEGDSRIVGLHFRSMPSPLQC